MLMLLLPCIISLSSSGVQASVSHLDLNSVDQRLWNHPQCSVGNETGSCVFSLACAHSGGKSIGVCKDRFYIRSCCQLPRHQVAAISSARPQVVVVEAKTERPDNQLWQCGTRSPMVDFLLRSRSGLTNHRRGRIIGGHPAVFGAWPWQVNLKLNTSSSNKHRCGAVIIGTHWVATAAHCVDGYDPHEFVLVLGEHNKEKADEPLATVNRQAAEIVIHPGYNDVTYENDLALMYILEDIPSSSQIQPVCLPDWREEGQIDGKMAFATGWGTIYEGGPKPNVLQQVTLPIINHDKCNKIFMAAGLDETLSDVFICAGYEEGGKDACEGDSGGPLVIQSKEDNRWMLAGIISWGRGCGEKYQPGVYTNVAKFREWIDSYITKN